MRRWFWLLAACAWVTCLTAQSPVPITAAWDLDPTHTDSAIIWTLEVDGVQQTCAPVMVTATERRCGASAIPGAHTFRLRGTNQGQVGAWSASVVHTVPVPPSGAPGVSTVTLVFEDVAPPPTTSLVRTNLLGVVSADGFGTGPFVTGSFTPPSNSLLVAIIYAMEEFGASNLSTDLTVSGGGLTFTQRHAVNDNASWAHAIKVLTAPVSTGGPMTLTLDLGARSAYHYRVVVVAYTGYNAGAPIGGTGGTTGAVNGAWSFSLDAAPTPADDVVAMIVNDCDASAGVTPGVGWTELYDWTGFGQAQSRTGSTSPTVAWADTHTGAGAYYKSIGLAIVVRD